MEFKNGEVRGRNVLAKSALAYNDMNDSCLTAPNGPAGFRGCFGCLGKAENKPGQSWILDVSRTFSRTRLHGPGDPRRREMVVVEI